jgi:RNA-directed DNA polymerase
MIQRRLGQELRKVEIEVNEEKTKMVDFGGGGRFGFLGFDFKAGRNRFGKQFVLRTPMRKKQSELLTRVGRIFKYNPTGKQR